MPLSQFGEGLRNAISFWPGTYTTSLVRNHCMDGVFREMESLNFPADAVEGFKDAVDANIYFLGEKVEISTMYIIVACTILLLITAYILMNMFIKRKAK